MKESLEEVKYQLLFNNSPSGTGFNNLFKNPNIFAKLQADPRTRAFLNDPDYVQIIKNLQNNPQSLQ